MQCINIYFYERSAAAVAMKEMGKRESNVKEDRAVWRLPQEINDTRSTDVCMVGVKWIVRRLW